jgi:hypothetical protein
LTDRIEYLAWSPDRATFVATMTALVNPLTGTKLATQQQDGSLAPSAGVYIDEIGAVVKTPGTYDAQGKELTPPEMVPGHHANLLAYGSLAAVLMAGGGWDGIFPLLGTMNEVPSEDGVPAGWQGTSGMRIYPAEAVSSRVRVWA